MVKNIRVALTIVLALSFFLGATVQYSEGSNAAGLALFAVSVILLSKVASVYPKESVKSFNKNGWILTIAGFFLISADLYYNYRGIGRSGLNTLDTMVLLLGISLISWGQKNENLRKLGSFGTVMSASFIFLFLIFYVALNHQLYKFDHYFVLIPSAIAVKALGVPIEIVGTETIRIAGVSDLVVRVGGPCSGLYSMFLLIGIVAGYSWTEGLNRRSLVIVTGMAALTAYIGNLIRVSAIYIVGYLYGPDVMMRVHVHLGWIIFSLSSLLIFLVLERAQRIIGE